MGNLQSGNTGNVDVMLTGQTATMDDGIVKLEISYEDDAGNVTTEEKEITLFVNEPMMDDMMMGDDGMMGGDMMMDDGEGGNPKTGIIVGSVSGAVVLAGVGLGVFLKLRKKKKAALLEAQELAELEKELDE